MYCYMSIEALHLTVGNLNGDRNQSLGCCESAVFMYLRIIDVLVVHSKRRPYGSYGAYINCSSQILKRGSW